MQLRDIKRKRVANPGNLIETTYKNHRNTKITDRGSKTYLKKKKKLWEDYHALDKTLAF